MDASTRVRGAVFEGFVARVRTSEPVAHKPLGARSSLLSSKGFSATARTAACTDSHRQHVCGLVHKSPFAPVLCANRQQISCYGRIVTPSPSEQRTSPVSWTAGLTCFRGRGFLKESGGCTPSRFGWFGPSTGEWRWICLPWARRRTARCSSPCLIPHWKGTYWHRAGQQPGCMCFLRSRYCHWCYASSRRSELHWYSSPRTCQTSLDSQTW